MAQLRSHLLPLILLLFLGTFFYFIDGVFSFDFRLEEFVEHPFLPYLGGTAREDTDFHSACIEKTRFPDLYPRDILFNVHCSLYPGVFFKFMALVSNLFGLEAAFVVVGYLVNVVFWLGLYFLFNYFSGSRWAAVLVAWAATVYFRRALVPVGWGVIKPQRLAPRMLVFPFTPWLVYLFFIWRDKTHVFLVFLMLGLLANIHSLTALHLGLVLGVVYFFYKLRFTQLPMWLICVGSFVLGSAPFLLSIPMKAAAAQAYTPEEILQFRVDYLFPPTFPDLIHTFLFWFKLPLVLGLGGVVVKIIRGELGKRDFLLLLFLLVTILFSLVAYLLPITGGLLSVSFLRPLRASQHIYTVLFVYGAVLLAYVFDLQQAWLRVGALFALLPFFIFPRWDTLYSFSRVPVVGVKEKVQLVLRRQQASPEGDQDLALSKEVEDPLGEAVEHQGEIDRQEGIDRVANKDYAYPQADWEAFYALTNWFKENTGLDSLVLIPPDGFNLFRTYSHRSIFVSAKDGAASIFSGDYGRLWYKRYTAVKELYLNGGSKNFVTFVKENDIDYVILADKRVVDLPLLFEVGEFRTYVVNE